MLTLVGLLCILAVVFRYMTAEERRRAAHNAAVYLEGDPQIEPFADALRQRTRYALATPALVVLCLISFLPVLFDSSRVASIEGLVDLGGNYALRTTNGEWGRLVKSLFIHTGLIHFLITCAGLFQIGLIAERSAGPLTFLAVFVACGVFANLIALYQDPLTPSVGPSAAILGVYGLFISSAAWAIIRKSPFRPSIATLARIGPGAAIFLLHSVATSHLSTTSEIVGFMAGSTAGAFLAKGIGERKTALRQLALAAPTALVIAMGFAFTLRGVEDVRPEIARVVAVEAETARAYDSALERFRNGRLSAEALAGLIDTTILPQLQAAEARLKAFRKVPAAHRPLVAGADEYLRLRYESWRLRATALRTMARIVSRKSKESIPPETVTTTLRQAERIERDSLASLRKIKPVG